MKEWQQGSQHVRTYDTLAPCFVCETEEDTISARLQLRPSSLVTFRKHFPQIGIVGARELEFHCKCFSPFAESRLQNFLSSLRSSLISCQWFSYQIGLWLTCLNTVVTEAAFTWSREPKVCSQCSKMTKDIPPGKAFQS